MKTDMVKTYSLLVQFLCHMLGPNYEVVLYDCSNERPVVTSIANGHITGRTLGGGLTHALKEIMEKELWRTQDWQQHFREISSDGTLLRSSVLFLKNEQGKLEGLFCISFDDRRYKDLTEKLFALCHPTEFSVLDISIGDSFSGTPSPIRQENGQSVVSSGLAAMVDEAIAVALNTTEISPETLNKEARVRVIRLLQQSDFFARKGAISVAAEKLYCSKPSVYRYIASID